MEESAKQIVKPDHISYREYKKRLAKKPHQSFVIFVSTFFILLLAFLGIAKLMAPKVDITIGDTPEVAYDNENDPRGNVDERLKKIQDEDNNFTGAVDSGFSYELDEKVKIPDKKAKESEPLQQKEEPPIVLDKKNDSLIPNSVKEQIKEINQKQANNPESSPKPSSAPVPQVSGHEQITIKPESTAPVPVPTSSVRTYKVYVGSYDSAAQAEVAKTILAESGLSAATFVKNVNGVYTLQVGSYSSQDKAFAAAQDLLKNNFPARVVAD